MGEVENTEGPDLVVAGAGGGLIAALRAAQLGCSVLVVDANGRFSRGNNTSMSTAMIPGAGTRFQRAEGIDDSSEDFVADILAKTSSHVDRRLAESLASVSARLIEWMCDDLGLPLSLVTDFPYPGHSRFRCHTIPGRSGRKLLDLLIRLARRSELIDFMVPATLKDVLMDEGRVSAVSVQTPNGTEEIATASVLLATNGFGADAELVGKYIPEIAPAVYHGSEWSRGDALRIGASVGAATGYLDAYQGHAALAMPAATLAGWAVVMHGGFLVDAEGRRFGDETIGYSEYAREVIEHASGSAWMIFDQRIFDACQVFDDFKDTVAAGSVRWGASADEIAEITGIDENGLSETIAATRTFARGDAMDPYGRKFWEREMSGQVGAIAVRPALFHTQGGLQVNEDAQVVTENDIPVPRLYAAGGAAVGISGHGASGYLAGNGLLSALGLSFIAAESVAPRCGHSLTAGA